jgi:hypothetical protein
MNGVSTPQHSITCGPPAPTLNITSNPSLVDNGLSSEITWTVSEADSCQASGDWSGAKSFLAGTYKEFVAPVYPSSTYNLECTGPGGTVTKSVLVSTPSANISATPCSVSVGGTSCETQVSWSASNFLMNRASVTQGTDVISTALNQALPPSGVRRTVTVGNNTFTISDPDGSYSQSVTAPMSCSGGAGAWAGAVCAPLPIINISATPNLVRSGSAATLNIIVDSDFDLECTLSGGLSATFTHNASPIPTTHPPLVTNPLNSATIETISCTSTTFPAITANEEVRVNVVPIIQER